MPCKCDYMEATDWERELDAIVTFIDEVEHDSRVYSKGIGETEGNALGEKLCSLLQNKDVSRYSKLTPYERKLLGLKSIIILLAALMFACTKTNHQPLSNTSDSIGIYQMTFTNSVGANYSLTDTINFNSSVWIKSADTFYSNTTGRVVDSGYANKQNGHFGIQFYYSYWFNGGTLPNFPDSVSYGKSMEFNIAGGQNDTYYSLALDSVGFVMLIEPPAGYPTPPGSDSVVGTIIRYYKEGYQLDNGYDYTLTGNQHNGTINVVGTDYLLHIFWKNIK
jgi:hypothetical protein